MPKLVLSGRYCCVSGCIGHSDYNLYHVWGGQICEKHKCLRRTEECTCTPDYFFNNFPTEKKNPEMRIKWFQLLNRKKEGSSKLWVPKATARVCSDHFLHGCPTNENPYPTEKLGYESTSKVANITGYCNNKRNKRVRLTTQPTTEELEVSVNHDHSYFELSSTTLDDIDHDEPEQQLTPEADVIITEETHVDDNTFDTVPSLIMSMYFIFGFLFLFLQKFQQKMDDFKSMQKEIKTLKEENVKLRERVQHLEEKEGKCICKLSLFEQLIKKDSDVTFYTGLPSISVFIKLHEYISPHVRQLWRGPTFTSTTIKRKFKSFPQRFGPQRKISGHDQFLLMWMKIRLNSPIRDLADRFRISVTTCSRIFSSWTKASSSILQSFIFVPEQGCVNSVKPARFSNVKNLNMIIDCSELFIQSPKNHIFQKLTWSNYKHHNTLKLLIGISPNSMITFMSKAYCGSISDKKICSESEFYESLEPYCKVMADKGFPISQECAAHRIYLIVPPGKRGQAQMFSGDVLRTQEIAQLRILVEQVIRRLKSFRVFSQELPISMIRHVDDMIICAAAACNMKIPIMK